MSSNTASIKTIIFDLGKVLLDFDHVRACHQLAAVCGLKMEILYEFLFTSGLEYQYERGDVSTDELVMKLSERARQKIDRTQAAFAVANIFTLNTEVLKILEELKAQKYRLVLLSNTSDVHWRHCVENYAFLQWFDHHVLSFKVRAMKPEQQIYVEVLKHTRCLPHECFFTDDVLENILPAKALGIWTHHFTNANNLRQALLDHGVKLT